MCEARPSHRRCLSACPPLLVPPPPPQVVSRLEAVLSQKRFTQLGGLQLEKDVRLLVGEELPALCLALPCLLAHLGFHLSNRHPPDSPNSSAPAPLHRPPPVQAACRT